MTEAITHRRVTRRRGAQSTAIDDAVVVEEPLEIRLADTPIAVLMRTPGHDTDLVRGFALTEGIALDPSEISGVTDLGGGRVALDLADGVDVDPDRFRRNLYATSSCGVCGKASIDAVRVAARTAPPGPTLAADVLGALPATLLEAQAAFAATGGIHAAGAFTVDGELIGAREDVGRHNAVDKLVGLVCSDGWPIPHPILFVSGRVSFEIIQKAAVAGFPIVAGVSAASSLAIELADEMGLTLVGFVRDGGFNVYTGPERIA